MALVLPSKADLSKGVVLNLLAWPEYNGEAAFDSYLLLKPGGIENHTLTLVVRIYLKQVEPKFRLLDKWIYFDFDNNVFLIDRWSVGDWEMFRKTFRQQCTAWNNRFWLTPPNDFAKLDVKVGRRVVRPNIYCHLFVELSGSPGGAHREIEVANIDKQFAKSKYPGAKLDGGLVRSDASDYDSLDTLPFDTAPADERGQPPKKPVNFLTIVHEIGHAIGLPHIGQSHQDPPCVLAIALDGTALSRFTPALFKGGSNSDICYGSHRPRALSDNVMGMGTKFDETNAQPWRDRIARHTSTRADDWKVSMHRVPPRIIVA